MEREWKNKAENLRSEATIGQYENGNCGHLGLTLVLQFLFVSTGGIQERIGLGGGKIASQIFPDTSHLSLFFSPMARPYNLFPLFYLFPSYIHTCVFVCPCLFCLTSPPRLWLDSCLELWPWTFPARELKVLDHNASIGMMTTLPFTMDKLLLAYEKVSFRSLDLKTISHCGATVAASCLVCVLIIIWKAQCGQSK